MSKSKITRKDLYDLVWSKPLVHIAKEYCIKESILRNICKKQNIPLPQNGHWMKLKYGKKTFIKQLPISNSTKDKLINLTQLRENTSDSLHKLTKEILDQFPKASIVPKRLSKPCKLIRAAKEVINQQSASNWRGIKDVVETSHGLLSISVSKHNVSRALRVFDTLIKLLHLRGHRVIVNYSNTIIIIDGEKFKIKLREKYTRKKANEGSWITSSLVPNNKLSFKLDEVYSNTEWVEGKQPIEKMLPRITAALELKAKHEKKKRIERNKWHAEYNKRLAEEAFLKSQKEWENKKEEILINHAAAWRKANRKATMIHKYHPTLSQWEDSYFVTLTIKAVPAYKLNKWIKEGMIRGFKMILNRCKKRHQRGKGIKIMGVKSLECNYNPIKKTYNPHYHIIVPNKAIAELLKKEWQIQWTKKHTYKGAQYIRPITDMERDLKETIKYGSKIFTEPDMIKKGKNKISPKIYAAALHNIFVAMKGHRIFDKFGFELDKTETAPKAKQQILVDYEEFCYDSMAKDWLNYDTGELLTKFIPNGRLEYLLRNRIDKEMQ